MRGILIEADGAMVYSAIPKNLKNGDYDRSRPTKATIDVKQPDQKEAEPVGLTFWQEDCHELLSMTEDQKVNFSIRGKLTLDWWPNQADEIIQRLAVTVKDGDATTTKTPKPDIRA